MSLIAKALKRAELYNLQDTAGKVAVVEDISSSGPGVNAASKTQPERRRQKRAGVRLAVRVRPFDSMGKESYEVLVTVNASRQSLYFTTKSERYYPGMRLSVTFPYESAHDNLATLEESGEVTRTEHLYGKRIGVAVQLKSTSQGARPAVSRGAVAERRTAIRQPFSAQAVVVDVNGSVRLVARCSDLSLHGCYLDTLNPFPVGTVARVELRTEDTVFEAIAHVHSSHIGMGMGLCFQDLTPKQTSVLMHWLSAEPQGRSWAAEPQEIPKGQTTDKMVAINLVRHMISKGILTKADIAEIFFHSGISI